jgi:hypothetical protein
VSNNIDSNDTPSKLRFRKSRDRSEGIGQGGRGCEWKLLGSGIGWGFSEAVYRLSPLLGFP